MKPVLIGSRALEVWSDSFTARPDSDWDFICEEKDVDYLLSVLPEGSRIEVHSPDTLMNRELADTFRCPFGSYDIMSSWGLAIMKRSHLWRDKQPEKHLLQYHLHLLPLVADTLQPYEKKLLKELTKLTMEVYPQSNPKLNQTNEDFFDDAVKKVYDHDWLHELYAFTDKPMYEKMKKDFSLAKCEKGMWEEFTHEEKLMCVSEECYVIATERFMVPKDWQFWSKLAYIKALQKVCTTLTSGWFRDFAIDNYLEVIDLYDKSKFDAVKEKLDAHT